MYQRASENSPEKTKICDFAKTMLTDPEPRVANGALASMGRCAGAYIDAGLSSIEARAAKEPVSSGLVNATKDQCTRETFNTNGSPEQCKKVMGLLEKMTQA